MLLPRYGLSYQIINGELYNPITVDIWSSGITLFAMLCGFLPFDEDSKSVLYKKILACDYSIPKFVSPSAQDLIRKILVRNINHRYTINQIKGHPWFNLIKQKLPRGYIPLKDKIPIDGGVSRLAALKAKVSESAVRQMIDENSHNKYTTL